MMWQEDMMRWGGYDTPTLIYDIPSQQRPLRPVLITSQYSLKCYKVAVQFTSSDKRILELVIIYYLHIPKIGHINSNQIVTNTIMSYTNFKNDEKI